MNNAWHEIRNALSQARDADRAIKHHSSQMAALIQGRLRSIDPDCLIALKKELRGFNIQTGKWKP